MKRDKGQELGNEQQASSNGGLKASQMLCFHTRALLSFHELDDRGSMKSSWMTTAVGSSAVVATARFRVKAIGSLSGHSSCGSSGILGQLHGGTPPE